MHTNRFILRRRDFLKSLAGLVVLPFMAGGLPGCNSKDRYSHISGSIVGANHKTGHLLRPGNTFPKPDQYITTEVLIAGGGISGLSANRWLRANGNQSVEILELEDRVGGNSVSGVNKVSGYPWGAHYLPIPDIANSELLDFLQSIGVIKSFDINGIPVYNEYYLCHDPEERLFINGSWQEGIVPQFGVGKEDKRQIAKFFQLVEEIKTAKGSDGQYYFRIPIDASSADDNFRKLDKISFKDYLSENGYDSHYLLWYLEYCCKDDYGSNLQHTSAWAGLHYFASRRGKAGNAPSSAVLTWPEGHGFLVNALKQHAPDVKTGMLVYNVDLKEGGVDVYCYDVNVKKSVCYSAKKLLLATPQYVNKHILGHITGRKDICPLLSYAPWVVANITLTDLPQAKGFPLCWDNVIFGQDSVGYVHANHQNLGNSQQSVITYYLPLTTDDPVAARKAAYGKTYEDWLHRIISDLEFAHNDVHKYISHADIWIWGHGMVRPTPGYIWSKERQEARQPIDNKIFFAHTDLSGISVFEEAFYQGINAAKQMIRTS